MQSDVEEIHRRLVIDADVLANSVEQAFCNLDTNKLNNISDRWERILDLILKNSGGNDLVERCRGKMNPDDVGAFVSLLDQKDGIMLGNTPEVEDESEDETDTDTDSDENVDDSSERSEDDSSRTETMHSNMDGMEGAVAEAVEEVIVDGHRSVDFLQCGLLFTSNKTAQICVSSLSGEESELTESEDYA